MWFDFLRIVASYLAGKCTDTAAASAIKHAAASTYSKLIGPNTVTGTKAVSRVLRQFDTLQAHLPENPSNADIARMAEEVDGILSLHLDVPAGLQNQWLDEATLRCRRLLQRWRELANSPLNCELIRDHIVMAMIDEVMMSLDTHSMKSKFPTCWRNKVSVLSKILRSETEEGLLEEFARNGDLRGINWLPILIGRGDSIFGQLAYNRTPTRYKELEIVLSQLIHAVTGIAPRPAMKCVAQSVVIARNKLERLINRARQTPVPEGYTEVNGNRFGYVLDRDLAVHVCTEVFVHALLTRVRAEMSGSVAPMLWVTRETGREGQPSHG